MPDRQKCTAPATCPPAPRPPRPPRFNADEALRETFARQIRPEDRQTLATLCDAVIELTVEAPIFGDDYAFNGVRDQAAAAAAELQYIATYLAWSAGETEIDDMSRAEHKLADLAERIGEQLAALASELLAAVAATPADAN